MGKSNRVRADRYNKKASASVKFKQKKGMPLWAKSLIAAVITVAVLATCVFGVLSANGVIMRLRYPLRSENFKISGNMMSYYFYASYQSFQEEYSDYMDYFSLDTSAPLKDQVYGDTAAGGYETSFLGAFEGTWHDYFMNTASQQAKQILIYCEYAHENNISLEEEDTASIDVTLQALSSVAEQGNYTTNAYISQLYGSGVKAKDVRKAMELSALAQKAMTAIQDKVLSEITDADIVAKYESSVKEFNVVDYSYYTLTVNYTDVAKEVLGDDHTDAELTENADKVLEAYTTKINEAKELFDVLEGMTSANEFNEYLYNHLANKYYTEAYDSIDLEEDKLPDSAAVEIINKKMVDDILADVVAGKDTTDTAYVKTNNTEDGGETDNEANLTFTIGDYTVSAEFAKAIDDAKQKVFKNLLTDKGTYVVDKAFFKEDDEVLAWAFEDGRTAGNVKSSRSGDGAETEEVTKDSGKFTASVYFLTTPQRRDDSLTKNVAYMTFGSEASATAAINAFAKGTISKEAFDAVATENSATANNVLENYVEGYLGLDTFDKWLYNKDTVIGSYTKTPIAADESTYLVAFYYSDGEPNWSVVVKSNIFNEKYTESNTNMQSTYTVTIKDNLLNKNSK